MRPVHRKLMECSYFKRYSIAKNLFWRSSSRLKVAIVALTGQHPFLTEIFVKWLWNSESEWDFDSGNGGGHIRGKEYFCQSQMFCGFSHQKFWCGLILITCEVRRIISGGKSNQTPSGEKTLHLFTIRRMERRFWEGFPKRPQFQKWPADPGIPVYWHTRPVITKAS